MISGIENALDGYSTESIIPYKINQINQQGVIT